MNTNTKRMVLAAIAAFYVVIGGLWASNFIPLKQFDAQMARQEDADYGTKEYREADAYLLNHALSYEGKVLKARRFGSIILWGTIALAAGGGVLFFTRGRKTAQAGAQ